MPDPSQLRIAFVSSEVTPFSKTGGLADVSGALPRALRERGHEVGVFTPYYRSVARSNASVSSTGITVSVRVGEEVITAGILKGTLPGGKVPVYFVDAPGLYDRDGLYQADSTDHPDNARRFIFFSRAVLEALELLDFRADLIHVNDWQSALIPVYTRTLYRDRAAGKAGTLLTIHNLGYQGLFWYLDMPLTGLSWELFTWRDLEFHGQLNLLKGGIRFAGKINTVSPTYAREIRTRAFGHGLDGILTHRVEDLHGILNGIDTTVWNPATDPHLAANYSLTDPAGKAECRKALLQEAGIDDDGRPLFAAITRLDRQKGIDVLCEVLDEAVHLGMRLVILGTGDPVYHRMLEEAEARHPGKVKAFLTFDAGLAHRIEAGADVFLMPSRYEPCGLNQMMSLAYGTVPVVRATGGLADTVKDFGRGGKTAAGANGFVFQHLGPAQLLAAIARALRVSSNRPAWEGLIRTGMSQDWSWARPAEEYEELYRAVLRSKVNG